MGVEEKREGQGEKLKRADEGDRGSRRSSRSCGEQKLKKEVRTRTHIGAFCNISGTMKKRIMLPRMYTWSSCETRPSRPVTVMSLSEMFKLSSATSRKHRRPIHPIRLLRRQKLVIEMENETENAPSASFPRYSCPVFNSTVITCPSDSCRSLTGTPKPDCAIFAC